MATYVDTLDNLRLICITQSTAFKCGMFARLRSVICRSCRYRQLHSPLCCLSMDVVVLNEGCAKVSFLYVM